MPPPHSPYDPPRAHWYNGIFYFGYRLRRTFHLEEMQLKLGCSLPRLLAVLALPAYGYFVGGRRLIGQAVLAGYGVAAVAFVVWLGYPAANVVFGLMMSLHAIGVVYCLGQWWSLDFWNRVGLAIGMVALVSVGLYLPARAWVTSRWLIPLRFHGHVVVVGVGGNPDRVQRGDWVAYHTERRDLGSNVYIQGGYWLDEVRGVSGDRIRFAFEQYWVNDRAYPVLSNMPASGEWVVPEKQWFVWPELVINSHGVARESIAAAWRQTALVDQSRFVGRPFHHWFGRSQTLP